MPRTKAGQFSYFVYKSHSKYSLTFFTNILFTTLTLFVLNTFYYLTIFTFCLNFFSKAAIVGKSYNEFLKWCSLWNSVTHCNIPQCKDGHIIATTKCHRMIHSHNVISTLPAIIICTSYIIKTWQTDNIIIIAQIQSPR